MALDTPQPVKYRTPLRQAQRDLTRGRIKDAARDLFYTQHYDSTTMDEIAVAAGLRRSTLYLHYRDKSEILGELIADYTPKGREVMARLPGPHPTQKQVLRWIGDVVKFVADERVPLIIIMELRRNPAQSRVLEPLTASLIAALGTRNPAFAEAAGDGAEPMLRARALLLLQELTYVCELYLDEPGTPFTKALLQITAGNFERYLAAPA